MSFTREARKGRRLGRKPSKDSGVSHATRPSLNVRHPMHITIKLVDDLPSLRALAPWRVLRLSMRVANELAGFRVVEYSIQSNHMHLVCEGNHRVDVWRAMQGMKVRIAKRLNKLWGRRGAVFADRYHRRDLKTPTEVRNCLRYVLQNSLRHRPQSSSSYPLRPDPYSSGCWFTGWQEPTIDRSAALEVRGPTRAAMTWLLRVGWQQLGLLSILEKPATA